MENATKAMLIAAGVLIGVMILSLAAVLFSELQSYVESSHETVRFNEQNAFNSQFTKYINSSLTIQDVVTAANLAYENNINYNATVDERDNPATLYVAVYLNGTSIESDINDNISKLLSDNLDQKYRAEINFSENTGRVYKVNFIKE